MRGFCNLYLAGVILIALPSDAAEFVKLNSIPGSTSTSTSVFGINDENVIVGGYVASKDGREHAFFGPANGNYRTFEFGGGGSEARGINNAGYITGVANTDNGDFSSEPMFERRPNGKILQITRKGAPLFGLVQGINNSQNKFAGGYWDKSTPDFKADGFLGSNGRWQSHVYVSAPTQSLKAFGINSRDVTVGYYISGSGHGFVRMGKNWSSIDYPGAAGTQLMDVNDKGSAIGQWLDDANQAHSFVLDIAANTFTDILITGANSVEAWGINSAGAVVVNTDAGPYVWCERQRACPQGRTASVDAPVHFVPTGLGKHFQ